MKVLRRPRFVVLLLALHAGSAKATEPAGKLSYAPPAPWVVAPPVPTPGTAPPDAPFRFGYSDQQVRIGSNGEESYTAYRIKILKPEALQAGNVAIGWNPSSGSATIHHLRIIRGQQVIDVLKGQRFQVIQREGGLEQSVLDGRLTAMLQTQGLQVGDELEFAASIVQRDPTLGDHAFGLAMLPAQGLPGAFRYRLSWPDAEPVAWRATRDLPQAVPTKAGGQATIVYELRDPGGVIINMGAPDRYNIRRLIEFSDFAGWSEISRRFALLFDTAARLSATSPVHAEAAKIAAAYPNPAERAQAALQLVQDQIRYVYVGLDGGNFRPASADETWQRRFGDCKAKTALLLALLRELKIEAEPMLVNAANGDGIDARLPNPGVFNHVLVRTRIDGKAHWLDGTRLGDRYLDRLPPPPFRWALPVRAAGADLEEVPQQPASRPLTISVVDIDARAGFSKLALVKAQHILRDDEAFQARSRLVAFSPEDADRAVRTYWQQQMDWVEPERVGWRYDERRKTLIFSLEGEGRLDWDGNDNEGRDLTIIGAGFYPPDLRRRPKEQDQTAPWATLFPRFRCYATSIRLPPGDPKWRWAYRASAMDIHLGGTAYWRTAGLRDNLIRTVMSSRTEKPEISAQEALATNEAIPDFDNKVSRVYQVAVQVRGKGAPANETLPFGDDVDWTGDVPMCSAPGR